MKAYDIESKSYHKVISINYDENVVVVESQHGRVEKNIDKVRLIQDPYEGIKGKTIIQPKLFWMIPFVGWFIIPYKIFSIDDSFIEARGFKQEVIMMVASFGPIFLLLFLVLITIQ